MLSQIYKDAENKMNKAIDFLIDELSTIRTGRASTSLIENIKVDYYGSLSPLKNIAHISAPDAQLIVIQPFDPTSLEMIEKAIMASDLGMTPNNDGAVVRLNVPALTEERRNEIIKLANKFSEDSKVSIRNIRRQQNEELKKICKDQNLSEDDLKRELENIQEITNDSIKKIDGILVNKVKDIKL